MRIYRLLCLFVILLCGAQDIIAQCKYSSGNTSYEVRETKNKYEVLCTGIEKATSSRNRDIIERSMRLTAVDLIGTYIVFKRNNKLPSELFQVYVNSINLHYNAYIEGLSQSENSIDGKIVTIFSCNKDQYRIDEAVYKNDIDVASFLKEYYRQNKNENAASLVLNSGLCDNNLAWEIEHDFMSGRAALRSCIRQLQNISDRFELSVLSIEDARLGQLLIAAESDVPTSIPYKLYYYSELVTSMPLEEKDKNYQKWQKELAATPFIWNDFRLFCARQNNSSIGGNELSLSEVIEKFGLGIKPIGMSSPIDDKSYRNASLAYANSNFEESAKLLMESIDCEGISSQSLSLLGASFRFLNKPERALPYLVLCFNLNPRTQYLCGNIALCAKALKYNRLQELCSFLDNWARDSWSINEIKNCKTNN